MSVAIDDPRPDVEERQDEVDQEGSKFEGVFEKLPLALPQDQKRRSNNDDAFDEGLIQNRQVGATIFFHPREQQCAVREHEPGGRVWRVGFASRL